MRKRIYRKAEETKRNLLKPKTKGGKNAFVEIEIFKN